MAAWDNSEKQEKVNPGSLFSFASLFSAAAHVFQKKHHSADDMGYSHDWASQDAVRVFWLKVPRRIVCHIVVNEQFADYALESIQRESRWTTI